MELTTAQINENYETYINLIKSVKRDGIDKLVDWLNTSDLKIAPASTKYHSAYAGGLVVHLLNTYKMLKKLISIMPENKYSEETIIVIALLHDIAKINFYDIQERNTKDEHGNWIKVPYYAVKPDTDRLVFSSHPVNCYYMASKFIKLSYEEELAIIHHEGAFESGKTSQSMSELMSAYKRSTLALLLHFADMYATCVIEGNNE